MLIHAVLQFKNLFRDFTDRLFRAATTRPVFAPPLLYRLYNISFHAAENGYLCLFKHAATTLDSTAAVNYAFLFCCFCCLRAFSLGLHICLTIILAARTRKDYTVGRYVFIAILCREHCLRGLYPVTLRFRALRAASEQDLCLLAIVNGFILTAMPQLMVKALSLQAMRRYRAARINCPCYYLNSSNSRSILNRIILVMFL